MMFVKKSQKGFQEVQIKLKFTAKPFMVGIPWALVFLFLFLIFLGRGSGGGVEGKQYITRNLLLLLQYKILDILQ